MEKGATDCSVGVNVEEARGCLYQGCPAGPVVQK